MKFFTNPFKSKSEPIVEESIMKLVDKDTVRISYRNIYGDEESCQLKDWSKEPRSTGITEDIIRLYLYDNDNLKYVIRTESSKLVFWRLDISDKNDVVSIDKSFIDKILNQLEL